MPVEKFSEREKEARLAKEKPHRKWVKPITELDKDIQPEEYTGGQYQMNRRRHTKVPGYGGVLPKVFPFKVNVSLESAHDMMDSVLHVGLPFFGICVQNHPSTVDGHVTVWLSIEVAEYLERMDMLNMRHVQHT